MKRFLLIATVAMVFAALVLALPGCGGSDDTAKAQTIIKEADQQFKTAMAEMEKNEKAITAILMNPTAAGNQEKAKESVASIDKWMADLDKIAKKYQEVQPLQGVGFYQTYANYMTNAIAKYNKLATDLKTELNNVAAGKPVDPNMATTLQNDKTEADKALKNAEQYKKEKNLTGV